MLTALRQAVRAKLVHARAVLENLDRQGEPGPTTLAWQKGYVRALEAVLDLEGFSLRRHPRWETDIPAQIARMGPKKGAAGQIVDLSVGGCRLVTAMQLSAGDVVELSFKLPERSMIATLQGVVRRALRVDEEYRVGLEFVGTPEDIAEALGIAVTLGRSWALVNLRNGEDQEESNRKESLPGRTASG
ncbi:MAG: PilZ domain-containing protein [Candidatus Methylomirabilia bacterium]